MLMPAPPGEAATPGEAPCEFFAREPVEAAYSTMNPL